MVSAQLLPRLEQAGLRVCFDKRDLALGSVRVVAIDEAIDCSRHTLLVITPEWLNSEWGQFQALLVQSSDLEARTRRLIPLLLRPTELPRRLKMLEAVDFTQSDEREFTWERLLFNLNPTNETDVTPPPLAAPRRFYVPFLRNDNFQGREADLTALHVTLAADNPVGIPPRV